MHIPLEQPVGISCIIGTQVILFLLQGLQLNRSVHVPIQLFYLMKHKGSIFILITKEIFSLFLYSFVFG